MIRWWQIAAIAIGAWLGMLAVVNGDEHGYLFGIGTVTANQQESDSCMFAIGQHAMVILHPNGEPCKIATSLLGKAGRLVFVPDDPTGR